MQCHLMLDIYCSISVQDLEFITIFEFHIRLCIDNIENNTQNIAMWICRVAATASFDVNMLCNCFILVMILNVFLFLLILLFTLGVVGGSETTAMFPLELVASDALEEIVKCAKQFMEFQVSLPALGD